MATATRPRRPPAPRLVQTVRAQSDVIALATIAAGALLLAVHTHALDRAAVPDALLGTFASLVLFILCGAALSLALVPAGWGPLPMLLSIALGAFASGLVLTALGLAHVPLHVSLWITLTAGLISLVLVLRRRRGRGPVIASSDRRSLVMWLATLVIVYCVGMIPVWRWGMTTVFGQNPDSHQVVGSAILVEHVPPTATDLALPVNEVPPNWRFRYPIFYPLAAASMIGHIDPIDVFASMSALLVVITALGFGAFAVRCLRAPPRAGPVIAAASGFMVITLYLAWWPYWNQLWGLAAVPYVLLFGWVAIEDLDPRAAVVCALLVVMLALSYPVAVPDPLVVLLALAIAYRPGSGALKAVRSRSWILGVLILVVLTPALIGAGIKLEQGIVQLFNPNSALWGGGIKHFLPFGRFVGTGGGLLVALLVAAVAALGLLALPRNVAIAAGAAVAVLCLVDIRFRLSSGGAYMDFKQLSFVGAILVAMAGAALAHAIASRRAALVVAGVAAAAVWGGAALVQDDHQIFATSPQVDAQMLQIRDWVAKLPRGSSVRIDMPPSGYQVWSLLLIGDHPVDAPDPLVGTTYAHPPYGIRADYSLAWAYQRPMLFAVNPPLFANGQFVLRKIDWPASKADVPETASRRMVEP